jgi:hypothetical protein
VITRAGALLGLPPGVPDPVWHIAFWRDLLVVLALAAAAGEARGRRTLALGIATGFAVLAVGFWAAALGRPYAVLSDPGTTRWAADVAVAGWAGGTDGFVVGEPSLAGGWGGLARRLRPDLVLLMPTLLPLLVIPATAALIAALGPRPHSTQPPTPMVAGDLAAILWVAAGTGTLEMLRGLGFLPGLWARPGPAVLWMATVAFLLAAARTRSRAAPVVAAVLAAAIWIAVGSRGPEVRLADALLALTFDQHILLVAGLLGLRRTRDSAAGALVSVGAVLVLIRALAGIGDAWAGLALYRLGLLLGAAAWLDAFAAALPVSERVRRMSERAGAVPARLPVALVVMVTMAGGVLAWWDPPRTDPVAKASMEPIPPTLAEAMDWMRAHTDAQASVLAPDDYAAAVAVLGGRRVLRAPSLVVPVDDERRLRLERGLFAGQPPAALLQRYGVRYVFLAPGQFREYGIEQPEDLERTGIARTIYANEKGMRLYEIAGSPAKAFK